MHHCLRLHSSALLLRRRENGQEKSECVGFSFFSFVLPLPSCLQATAAWGVSKRMGSVGFFGWRGLKTVDFFAKKVVDLEKNEGGLCDGTTEMHYLQALKLLSKVVTRFFH